MFRRRYLAVLMSGLIAGCAGEAPTATETPTDAAASSPRPTDTAAPATETPTPTESPTPTDTATPEASVSLAIGDPTSVSVDLGYYSGPAWEAPVQNTGTAASGEVWLSFDWFDGNGEYLNSFPMPCASIGPGETWAARAYPDSVDGTVKSAEVALQDTPPVLSFGVDGVELVDSTFRASSDQVLVRGTAENTRDSPIGYLLAVGKVYAKDGTLLAAGYTNETDIAAGSTWRFEMQPWTVDRNDIAASGEVLLSTGNI